MRPLEWPTCGRQLVRAPCGQDACGAVNPDQRCPSAVTMRSRTGTNGMSPTLCTILSWLGKKDSPHLVNGHIGKCAEPRRDTSPTRHQKATSMTLCRHTGSSQGPPDLQSDARPAELSMHMIHSHTPDESLAHTYGDAEAEQQTHASPVAAVLLGCAKDKFDSQTRTAGAIRSRGCDGRGVAPWRGPSTGQAIKILLSPQPPPLPPTHEATQNL